MLSQATTLRGCLIDALAYCDEQLVAALEGTFSTEGEATRYVVAPLLAQQGPLDDTLTKARLLVALGHMDPLVFEDLQRLQAFRDRVIHTTEEIGFSDPGTLDTLGTLMHFDIRLVAQFRQRLTELPDDPTLRRHYLNTVDNSIRSALLLAVETLGQKMQVGNG